MPVLDYIDDVYKDVDSQRHNALAQKYICTTNFTGSPGKSVHMYVDETSESFIKIKKWFHDKGLQFYVTEHKYRIATEEDLPNIYAHYDKIDYHVVISLSPNHEEMEDYELALVPKNNDFKYVDRFREKYDTDYYNANIRVIEDNRSLENDFNVIERVQFKYNRAVFINSTWFHSPTKPNFGKTNNEARLIELYCISTVSNIVEIPYCRYIWYFKDVLPKDTCREIYQITKEKINQIIDTCKKRVIEEDYDDILSYKNHIIERMVCTYIDYATFSNDEICSLFKQKQYGNRLIRIKSTLIYVPQHHFRNWEYELSTDKATFVVLLNLNYTESGITVVDHYKYEPHIVPSDENSMIIMPYSWLYPYRQARIEDTDKYMLKLLVSL